MPTTSTTDVAPSATAHGSGGFFSRKASLFQSGRTKPDRDSSAYFPLNLAIPPPETGGAAAGAPLLPSARLFAHQRSQNSQGGSSSGSGTPVENASPPRSRKKSRHSLSSSVTDFGNAIRRSASLRSNSGRSPTSYAGHPYGNGGLTPDGTERPHFGTSKSTLSLSSFTRRKKSVESLKSLKLAASGTLPPEGTYPTLDGSRAVAMNMTAVQLRQPAPRPTGTSQSNVGFGEAKSGMAGSAPTVPSLPTAGAPVMPNSNVTFQHIHDMAAKRINTLDYLRKAHEGRTYHFNTILFSQSDLRRLPSHQPPKLARRATNYLLLGFSLPQVFDFSTSQSAADYLRNLNQLLLEFEQYQQAHPSDGTAGNSLTKARIPHMFRRATGASKNRRASSAADLVFASSANSDIPEPQSATSTIPPSFPSLTLQTSNISMPTSDTSFVSASWSSDPQFGGNGGNDSYTLLMTPNLPFDPDFYETFATLCDVLIDVYRAIMDLVSAPERVAPGVGELFSKADAKVRKILVSGILREFEDSARVGVKAEVGGIGRVVLGGLM